MQRNSGYSYSYSRYTDQFPVHHAFCAMVLLIQINRYKWDGVLSLVEEVF